MDKVIKKCRNKWNKTQISWMNGVQLLISLYILYVYKYASFDIVYIIIYIIVVVCL